MVNQYNLDDYTTIHSEGFDYCLPDKIHANIQTLTASLGISSPSSHSTEDNTQQPQRFPGSEKHNKARKQRSEKSYKKNIDTSWEKQPDFVATKIEKKEGVEKLINDIRVSLNKISAKNYDTHRDNIFKNIDDIIEQETEPAFTEIDKIAAAIFDIASTNKFYSELYATLYKELTEKYPIFSKILDTFISTSYKKTIELIDFADENKDYEKYCRINKENDKRKAMTVFIVNLMKKTLVTEDNVTDMILFLQGLISNYIDEPNKTYIVEEITENIFLFLTTSIEYLDKWNAIVENVKKMSQLKVKEHQSISSRAIFKYKDLVDLFSKKSI